MRYTFGESITFSARLEPAAPIQGGNIYITAHSSLSPLSAPLQFNAKGELSYTYTVQPGALKPFESVFYTFEVTLADGQTLTSPQFSASYDDNRFTWSTLDTAPFTVSWAQGDAAFGQSAADAARRGAERFNQFAAANLDAPVRIFIYPSAADLQSALNLTGQSWVDAHTTPELGVLLVSAAPSAEQKLELERQVPHELAHLLLYRATGDGYNSLPAWLKEGIASNVELNPNPDYARVLADSSAAGKLIPFSQLCASFPPEPATAYLAYAQSESFVRYLQQTYGQSGLQNLVSAYKDGMDCDNGANRAFGISLAALERRWRQDVLKENLLQNGLLSTLPFIILLLALLSAPLWIAFSPKRANKA